MGRALSTFTGRSPQVLTVPGLNGSGALHWQTLWEERHDDTRRADLGQWSAPRRNAWVTRLDQSIRATPAPVVLVAHSLGCLAVAWWAELSGQPWASPVAGALLVAPPDVDRIDACAELRHFAPSPKAHLPFPSILVASRDDPYCAFQRAVDLARYWGSHVVDAGEAGHLNAGSGLGGWPEGRALLARLIDVAEDDRREPGSGDLHAALTNGGMARAKKNSPATGSGQAGVGESVG